MSQSLEIGAAYIRVSTDDQTELSPNAQLRTIMDAAKQDGFIIPQEFVFEEERGISGRKAENRPQFQRMIATAKSQSPAPFSRLYVWKFSRFARNQEESTFYKGILRKKCGVEVKSVSEPIAEGMFGRLIETIIEWFDEYYSYNLSGEVIRGMTEKALRNGYQSVPSLGYRAVGQGKPFVIDPEKMPIVEYIFRAYHDGMDMTKIARNCNASGWKTRRGRPFERRTILRILQNKFYIGTVEWNGYSFQGTHEISPLIREVYEDVQARMQREYKPLRRREVSSCKHWLSGTLRCGYCGASLAYNRNCSQKGGSFFKCWKQLKGYHSEPCGISECKIVKAVLQSMENIIRTGRVEYECIPKNNEKAPEEKVLKDALARVDIKEQRIRDAYEAGADTLEEYKNNKTRIQKEREDLRAELDRLAAITAPEKPSTEEMVARIKHVYELVSDPDVENDVKGIAIRSVLKEVIVDKAHGELRFVYYV
ncbi:recombinase family protein [Brotaphodocola sp.]|uniref:recombinase family protein n=1 Tax=Brotaphodocola sp. TaxID=3073577 RepID=UPI003D7E7A31